MVTTSTEAVPVNVVCLKWGTKYPAEYVNRLYRMVKQNISLPYRFICLTENPDGIMDGIETKSIAFDPDLHGWWYKLQLFQHPLHDIEGPTLFLDLDVVIVDNIDTLFSYEADSFCIIKDLQADNLFNSSVFRLKAGSYPEVWDDFQKEKKAIVNRLYGDQDWVSEKIPDPALWPKEHGKPDPDDVAYSSYDMWKHAPWIKDAWNDKNHK